MRNRYLLFVILTISIGFGHSESDFTYYGNMGPDHWSEHYNQCAGKQQSPIDINEVDVRDREFTEIFYKEFGKSSLRTTMTNNGHTVLVKLVYEDQVVPYIYGGPLEGKGKYEFQQLHFHWGEDNTVGSEDRINNVSYPMELHMVFRNARYKDFDEAARRDDGLAVLAFFYEIDEKLRYIYKDFTGFLANIIEPNSLTDANQLNLFELMPKEVGQYFTYIGSLTTPPCSEDVIWLDYIEPIPISSECMDRFRALKTFDGSSLGHNFRPVQPLNNRKVYRAVTLEKMNQFNPGSDIPLVDAWDDEANNANCYFYPVVLMLSLTAVLLALN